MRQSLTFCFLLSIGLHGAVFGIALSMALLSPGGTATHNSMLRFSTRFMTHVRPSEDAVVPKNISPPEPAPVVAGVADQMLAPSLTGSSVQTSGIERAIGSDEFDDFHPRSDLTSAPLPAELIMVPYPEGVSAQGEVKVVLLLYIDDAGRVLRTRQEGPPVPPEFERAAQDAFTVARFRPGQIDGRPVRSMIRVEVTFEGGPSGRP